LLPGSAYASISVTATVSSTAPATLTNSASVSVDGIAKSSNGDQASIAAATACDLTPDTQPAAPDVSQILQEALGIVQPAHDFNSDGAIDITDVQVVANAAIGLGCMANY
jgi:hypothetical protein